MKTVQKTIAEATENKQEVTFSFSEIFKEPSKNSRLETIKEFFSEIKKLGDQFKISFDFYKVFPTLNSDELQAISDGLKESINLISLDLRFQKLEDFGVKIICEGLKHNKTLVILDMMGNKIGNDGANNIAQALKVHKTLKILTLKLNNISDQGAMDICNSQKENSILTTLDLSNNKIEKTETIEALQKTLKTVNVNENIIATIPMSELKLKITRKIVELTKDRKNITFSFREIFEKCPGDSRLEIIKGFFSEIKELGEQVKISFDFHKVTPILNVQELQAIATGLEDSINLAQLNFCAQKIGDVGVTIICEGLLNNKTLLTLEMSDNNIGRKGASGLAKILKSNKTLTGLFLENNEIEDDEVLEMCQSLIENPTLMILDLSSNKLCGRKTVLNLYKVLLTVKLDNNYFDESTEEIIKSRIEGELCKERLRLYCCEEDNSAKLAFEKLTFEKQEKILQDFDSLITIDTFFEEIKQRNGKKLKEEVNFLDKRRTVLQIKMCELCKANIEPYCGEGKELASDSLKKFALLSLDEKEEILRNLDLLIKIKTFLKHEEKGDYDNALPTEISFFTTRKMRLDILTFEERNKTQKKANTPPNDTFFANSLINNQETGKYNSPRNKK